LSQLGQAGHHFDALHVAVVAISVTRFSRIGVPSEMRERS
jgi:hypothetical protein